MSFVACDFCNTCFDYDEQKSYDCFLCHSNACKECGKDWVRAKNHKRVCDNCSKVNVSSSQVFNELLARYKALGGDPNTTYTSVMQSLQSMPRKTRLQVWNELN